MQSGGLTAKVGGMKGIFKVKKGEGYHLIGRRWKKCRTSWNDRTTTILGEG